MSRNSRRRRRRALFAAYPGLWGACALIATLPFATAWLVIEYDHYAQAHRPGVDFAMGLAGASMPGAFRAEAWQSSHPAMPKASGAGTQKPGSVSTEPIASLAEMAPIPPLSVPGVAPPPVGRLALLQQIPAPAAIGQDIADFLDVRRNPRLAAATTVWILVIGSALFLLVRVGLTMSGVGTFSAMAADTRLRSAVQRMRDETHDIAHDMGTPLATISLALAGIRRALPAGSASSARAAATIDRSLVRLADLLEQARDLGDAAAATMLTPRRAVDLASVVRGGLDEMVAEGGIDGWSGQLARHCIVAAPAEPLVQMVHDALASVAGRLSAGQGLLVALACDTRVACLDIEVPESTRDAEEREPGEIQLPIGIVRKVTLLGGVIEATSRGGVRILLPVDGEPLAGAERTV